jgi:solute carrier family 8 (sodium/calcium exchanger)
MALGSSAPEILLNVLETIQTLGQTAGELGPSTIVGSAAFNLLVISGASIIAVSEEVVERDKKGKVVNTYWKAKKIDDMGVFACTSLFSIFAYVWLYICLADNVISVGEAWLTLFFMFLLLCMAFAADKYNESKKKKLEDASEIAENDRREELKIKKSHLRLLAKRYGERAILSVAQGHHSTNKEMAHKVKESEKAEIITIFKEILGTDDLSQHKVPEFLEIL